MHFETAAMVGTNFVLAISHVRRLVCAKQKSGKGNQMGGISKENMRLLKASFSSREWEFLKRNAKFKTKLKNAKDTLDNFERLARLGNDLIFDFEIETRLKPQLRKLKKEKRPQAVLEEFGIGYQETKPPGAAKYKRPTNISLARG